MRHALLALALTACVPPDAPELDPEAAARVWPEGTPEARGVTGLLNDPCTTYRLLDVDAALDARAARNLIAWRNGPDGRLGTADDDPFDSLAEVDAVPRVGDATILALLRFATTRGWVMTDLYGGVECVPLSVPQSWDLLRVANGATFDELDLDAALDVRAAQGVVDARPFGIPEDVATATYVGATAIRRMVAWGATMPVIVLGTDTSVPVLEIYSAGLWFMSESDYPMDVWVLPDPGVPVTAANARDVLAGAYVPRVGEPELAQRETEQTDLAWVFDRTTVEQPWWDDAMRADAVRWSNLRRVFETQLDDVQVFRFGVRLGQDLSGAIDVFIVGRTREGDLVGVRTVSVET